MNDWQYTNQFFEEGNIHQSTGGSVDDCPYDYLSDDIDQEDPLAIQKELYRQQEWLAGFQYGFMEKLQKAS